MLQIVSKKGTSKQFKPMIYFELLPKFLLSNDEDVMSIFTFFESLLYKNLILYVNIGYMIGLFEIKNKREVERIIEYVNSKNMHLDVLVSTKSLDEIYKKEAKSINKILSLKNS